MHLDELLKQADHPSKEWVCDYESRALREVRERLTGDGLAAGFQAAEAAPHPRLFRLVAEQALEALDLTMAEKVAHTPSVSLSLYIYISLYLSLFSCLAVRNSM